MWKKKKHTLNPPEWREKKRKRNREKERTHTHAHTPHKPVRCINPRRFDYSISSYSNVWANCWEFVYVKLIIVEVTDSLHLLIRDYYSP